MQNAISQLEEALVLIDSDVSKADSRFLRHLRAAAIQAFEFTFELSYKMVKRFLETTEANPSAIDEMSFNEIIRRAHEVGILKAELKLWQEFRKDRGTTSHTYNEDKAQDVFETIPAFLSEVKFLLEQLQKKQKLPE